MQENKPLDHFVEFEKKTERRRKLLPWWIRFFSWVFMILSGLGVLSLVLGVVGVNTDLSIYGFETNRPLSLLGLMIIAIMFFKGWVGFSLFYEKDIAVKLGKIDATLGVIICIISMTVLPFQLEGNFLNIRLEILFLIPFLIKLFRIEKEWDARS